MRPPLFANERRAVARDSRFPILALPAILLLAAGCISTDVTPTMPPEDDASSVDAQREPILALSDCHQMHLAFTARPADFESELPEGFRVKPDDTGVTTTLGIVGTACGLDGTEVAEALVVLHVEPPPDLADPNTTHALVIEAYASEGELADRYAAWGLADEIVAGDVTISRGSLPGLESTKLTVATSAHRYEMTTVLTPSGGAFAGGRASHWIASEGLVLGRLVTEANASENVGIGSVHFTYSGSGGAPPVTEGVAHEVEGLALARAWEAVD